MRRMALVTTALSAASVLIVSRSFAQDINAMAKWTAASIIHYRVVGEFKGKTTLLKGKSFSREAEVTDRVEVEFDWDQTTFKLARPAVFKNVPTTVGAIDQARFAGMRGTCPAPRVEGALEFATVVGVTDQNTQLQIEMKRERPGGAIPYNGESNNVNCGDVWDPAAPASETVKESLAVPPGMLLAMPAGLGDMKLTPDGKSIVAQSAGWTWTFTPTIVK